MEINKKEEIIDENLIAKYWTEFNKEVKCEPSVVLENFGKFLKERYDIDLILESD